MSAQNPQPIGVEGATGALYVATPTPAVETGGTTRFTADTVGNVAVRANIDDIDPSLYTSLDQSGAKDILDFLAKPTLLRSGNFTTTDVGNFAIFDLPTALLANTRIAQKLSGVGLMRADIVLTLQVNAVRFQQGRYILAWCPSGGVDNNSSAYDAFYRAHAVSTMNVTQLPHVELDIATQTTAELRIPYTSAFPLWKLSTATGVVNNGIGFAFLRPYFPLVAGSGDSVCSYMLFARFENVYLTGNVLPQMGKRVKGLTVARKEQQAAGEGPVSSVLGAISKGTSVLGVLPMIGPTLSGVSWATGILANAAAAFGFSKPTMLAPPNRVASYGFPYSGTADGFTTAIPLGLKSDHEVVVHSGVSRTTVDEMSIDFIKQQYAYYETIEWATSANPGGVLASLRHQPSPYVEAISANGVLRTPVAFVSSNFRLWRGGMKFRFKIVKTEFHSGRLIFAYMPLTLGTIPAAPPGIDTSTYLMREIVDIRDTSEVEFCIPYVITDLYLSTATGDANAAGLFHIIVGDALVAPTSVSSSVQILVEVAGAPDLEFALPANTSRSAFIPFATQCGDRLKLEDVELESTPETNVFQAGYLKHDCVELGTSSEDLQASAVAIGEKVESFRQLVKRVQTLYPSSGSYAQGAAGNNFIYFPYSLNPILETVSSGGALVSNVYNPDLITNLSMMYVFINGGMRLFLPQTSTANLTEVSVDRDTNALVGSESFYTATTPVNQVSKQIFFLTRDDPVHVSIPPYNRTIARPTAAQIISTYALYSLPTAAQGRNITAVTVKPILPSNSTMDIRPYRYCADDYSMGFWIGTVPTTT
jgi:hypothetical protein